MNRSELIPLKIENVHKCPYCGCTYQVVIGQNVFAHLLADPGGNVAEHSVIYVCPYATCRKTEIYVDAGLFPPSLKDKPEAEWHRYRSDLPNTFFRQRLLPAGAGGRCEFHVPAIPEDIYKDYDEACRLLPVSPNASATYARRCIQHMLRHKFKLKPGKLQNEINTLAGIANPVNQEVIDALDGIRKLGKFKALPEDDVKVIVDISASEAKRMIDVIEILLHDWFIAPEEHNRRLAELRSLGGGKGRN